MNCNKSSQKARLVEDNVALRRLHAHRQHGGEGLGTLRYVQVARGHLAPPLVECIESVEADIWERGSTDVCAW